MNRASQNRGGAGQPGLSPSETKPDAAGMKEVTYLDAIMHNKYNRVPDKLREWLSASHIERAPQREKKPAPKPPQ